MKICGSGLKPLMQAVSALYMMQLGNNTSYGAGMGGGVCGAAATFSNENRLTFPIARALRNFLITSYFTGNNVQVS